MDNVNNKELEHLKSKLESLSSDIQNISLSHHEVVERLEMLADKVDRLRLKKDDQGELHYVMVAKVEKADDEKKIILLLIFAGQPSYSQY